MELQFPNSDGSIFIEGTHHGGVSEWDGVCARVWVGRCTQDWRATLKIYVCMYVHASCHVIQVAMVVFWEILRVVYSKVETCAFRGIEMCLQLWYGGWGGVCPRGAARHPVCGQEEVFTIRICGLNGLVRGSTATHLSLPPSLCLASMKRDILTCIGR